MTATLRQATCDDASAIAEIYRHYVENTVATFDYEAPSVDAWREKITRLQSAGQPFVVAIDDDEGVAGFAYAGPFRNKAAYDWTVEDTIYVRPDAIGQGLGSLLLQRIIDDLAGTDVNQVVAVIAVSGDESSVRLHGRLGFRESGRLTQAGFKQGRWVDCVFMQRAVAP